MRENKMFRIGTALGRPFDEIIVDLYSGQQMTPAQISDYLFSRTKIFITPRSIQRQLHKLGLIRTLSEAFRLAIASGRKSYDKLL